MAADLVDTLINTGGGAGGGGLIAAIIAKYFGNKTEKEIEQIKKELAANKDADSLRDTAIELLKLEMASHKETSADIKMQLTKLDEKLEKKLDQIFEKLNR